MVSTMHRLPLLALFLASLGFDLAEAFGLPAANDGGSTCGGRMGGRQSSFHPQSQPLRPSKPQPPQPQLQWQSQSSPFRAYGDGSMRRNRSSRLFSSPLPSSMDDDRRPQRPVTPNSAARTNNWGIIREDATETSIDFPSTAETVVDDAFRAIAGILHDRQMADPNVFGNTMAKNVLDYRPVRRNHDAGRMGIELDGTKMLFANDPRVSPDRALRRVSLMLAAKLSVNDNWREFEDNTGKAGQTAKKNKKKKKKSTTAKANSENTGSRPVALYFNTVKQALMASKELALLRYQDMQKDVSNDETTDGNDDGEIGKAEGTSKSKDQQKVSIYDNIFVGCVGDELPQEMRLDLKARKKYGGLQKGLIDATKGIVVVVKPTDFNSEYKPPGPAADAITTFQALCMKTSVNELPTVAISPRFLANEAPVSGWDQSGYQRSSMYGGIEPPKGPTPWIMRDFTPPVYAWVTDAFNDGTGSRIQRSSITRSSNGGDDIACAFTKIAFTHSVMFTQHVWRIYAARECFKGKAQLPTSHHYLASTRSASGRPTRDILQYVIDNANLSVDDGET